ncbi:unnamed protein product [marine sediment metagenome]|uniref:Uncharacterized protein n=1 Tax=marine sediment metagenome TaxID=412755 RepID=X1STE6_9ZZZZ
MSNEFDDLMRRATCQMRVMLRERRRFRILAKELEDFSKEGNCKQKYNKRGAYA